MKIEYGEGCDEKWVAEQPYSAMIGWNMQVTTKDGLQESMTLLETGVEREGHSGFIFKEFVGDEDEASGPEKFVAFDDIVELYIY